MDDDALKKEWGKLVERSMELFRKARLSSNLMCEVKKELGGLNLKVSSYRESADKILLEAICEKTINDRWEYTVSQEFSGEVCLVPVRFR